MNDFVQFLAPNQDLSLAYLSTYNAPLVALSVLMAIFASFMALELSNRIAHAATAMGKIVWLVPGALALGGGVWAMHFIGMLAFSLPCGIAYDPILTLVSMVPGVAASAVALWTISRIDVSFGKLAVGGILMGGGIGAMHYSGMAAMRLDAAIYYSPAIFALSIGFAVVLAMLSLYAKFVFQQQGSFIPRWAKSFAAAIFMGAAISGMHYIAMEAAYFIPVGDSSGIVPGISPTVLAVGTGVTTIMLVALTLAGSILGRHVETINILEREVKERERAESALLESEERFSLAMRGANDGLWDWDFKTDDVYYSPRWCSMLGYQPEELEPNLDTWASLVHPQDKDRVLEEVNNYVEGRADAFDAEFRMRHKNGSWVTILSRAFLVHDNGDAVRLVGTHVDITERKRDQQRLIDAIESISEGFVLYDKNERLVVCNNKYREIYAASAEAMEPGATFKDIIRFGVEHNQYPEARGREEAFIEERARKHKNPTEVIEQQLSDGTWLRIDDRKTHDGSVVGIRTNITELKNNQVELTEHRDRLEEKVAERTAEVKEKALQLERALVREKEYNALQKKFVALASHEFRTPLSIIDSTAQRLIRRKDKMTTDEIEERADKVRSAVSRMISLIDTTLYASSLDEGKIKMEIEPCDIGSLLEEVCNRQAEISPNHQIQLVIEDLSDGMLIDPRLIDQIFTNLLSNAVKYAPDSPIIEVKGRSDGENALITITDQGVGISEEDLPHMFQRFFRAKTAEGIQGTGIGLSVVKELIQLHGGSIGVDSTEGEGTTFTVRLPIDAKSRNSMPHMEMSA